MDDTTCVFLFGDSLDMPHVRLDHGTDLVVSPQGSENRDVSLDRRQERGITVTPAQARRLAFQLLAALEHEPSVQ